jgi:hypothetical protein
MVKKANDEEEEATGSNEKPVGPTIEEMKQERKENTTKGPEIIKKTREKEESPNKITQGRNKTSQ